MKLRRGSIIALLMAAIALPVLAYGSQAAAATSGNPVIADCLAHPGGLTGHYSVAEIRHALQVMSPETREYTSCPDVLNRALLVALGAGTTGGGGSSGGGGGGGSSAFLPTPVIVVLVLLILAAVTFGALAIRRRQQGASPSPPEGPGPDGPDEPRPAGDH